MRNTLVPICLFGLLLYIGCRKPDPHIPIDPYLVNNFKYKPGTYWIFKDSLTGEKNTFRVNDIKGGSQTLSGNSSTKIDGISMDIYQYNELGIKVARWMLSMAHNSMSLYYGGPDPYLINLLTMPVEPGLIGSPDASDSAYVISINGSYIINSIAYTGVVKSRHFCDTGLHYTYFDNTYYMNEKFGFIKMDLNRGTHRIWELESSQIIR